MELETCLAISNQGQIIWVVWEDMMNLVAITHGLSKDNNNFQFVKIQDTNLLMLQLHS